MSMDSPYVSYKNQPHLPFFLLVLIFGTLVLYLVPSNKIFATLKQVCRKIENNYCILKCNLKLKKFRTHKTLARKIVDSRNTYEKKLWTHEIPMRRNFGPTKNTREKNSDSHRLDDTMVQDHDSARPTIFITLD